MTGRQKILPTDCGCRASLIAGTAENLKAVNL